jgi:hypothetical protein
MPAIWHTRTGKTLCCPYGNRGDTLWVRETWRPLVDGELGDCIEYRADLGRVKPSGLDENTGFRFSADCDAGEGRLRSSIHMPRWASRILLEVVRVRVGRLQDISTADAKSEGVEIDPRHGGGACDWLPGTYLDGYKKLWESINGAGSWAANPWVWVVEFDWLGREA